MEQQLSSSFSLRAAYVAEQSRHEWQNLELNPVVNGTALYNQPGCTTTNSCYPASNFITAANTGGNTNYNSLQVSAEQRVRYGLTLLFNYTWSKALDNMPYNQAATSIGGGNSFVYPYHHVEFQSSGLRTDGIRSSQRGRVFLCVQGAEGHERCSCRSPLSGQRL